MTVSPGWHDDGSGRQRWWDGRSWGAYADQMNTALPPKDVGAAYAFWFFTVIGVAGIQHFYLGKIGRGVLWLLTWGLFGIGSIIDLFTLPSQTKTINARRAAGIS